MYQTGLFTNCLGIVQDFLDVKIDKDFLLEPSVNKQQKLICAPL